MSSHAAGTPGPGRRRLWGSSVASPACCAPMGPLGFKPGVEGSLEGAARGPELSGGRKREAAQVLAGVCRPLNSKETRYMRENQLTATPTG